jgi:hypothetical protein
VPDASSQAAIGQRERFTIASESDLNMIRIGE